MSVTQGHRTPGSLALEEGGVALPGDPWATLPVGPRHVRSVASAGDDAVMRVLQEPGRTSVAETQMPSGAGERLWEGRVEGLV